MTPAGTAVDIGSHVWVDVSALDQLTPGRGVAALVDGAQVAIFRVAPADAVFAISNHDPLSGAFVLSRGVVGSVGDVVTVASPMYKQRFDLATGRCLEAPEVAVSVYAVQVVAGRVEVMTER